MTEAFVRHESGVQYLTSPLLDAHGVPHLFSLRGGGVSPGVFASLNFAQGSGGLRDTAENVLENHARAAAVFGLPVSRVCRSYQTHSLTVRLVDDRDAGRGLTLPPFDGGVDGLYTRTPALLLSVRYADCVPVLLCDRRSGAVAAVHSGWRGTLGGITANAVRALTAGGADAADILAAIGPCARRCCYEVSAELYDAFVRKDGALRAAFTPAGAAGEYLLDLPAVIRADLRRLGVSDAQISDCGVCTICGGDDYFSHRVMGENRGTMAAFIKMPEKGNEKQCH